MDTTSIEVCDFRTSSLQNREEIYKIFIAWVFMQNSNVIPSVISNVIVSVPPKPFLKIYRTGSEFPLHNESMMWNKFWNVLKIIFKMKTIKL